VSGWTALSIEFVSKPQEAYRLRSAIPAAIEGALGHVKGFAGCMLLIADKEARLVTVVTFWEGENRLELSGNSASWVHKLLAPFLDHCLQVKSQDAYFPTVGLRESVVARAEAYARGEQFSVSAA
jgi:hypothetical protein